MTFNRIIPKYEDIPQEFKESRNVWNKYAQARFFHTLHKSEIKVIRKQFVDIMDVDWIKSQLGGYDWDLVNMHLPHEHKIAACAMLFSQVYDLESYPDNLYEGVYVPPAPPTREEWLAQIRASAEKDKKEEEERKLKIENGEIVLPEPGRPYELWTGHISERKRIKTYRSMQALEKAVSFNVKEGEDYIFACCDGPDETSRHWYN